MKYASIACSLFPVPYSLKLNNFVPHEHGKCYINQIYEKNAIDPKKNLITVISSAYVSNSGGIYNDDDDD